MQLLSEVSNVEPDLRQFRTRLWENAQDSIQHALSHCSELRRAPDGERNHRKWIILSVHQMAECFSNILLIDLAPI